MERALGTTYVAIHSEEPGEIRAAVHAYGSFKGDYLNITTPAGVVTFHDIDMVTFKNQVLWAYQEWERKRKAV